MEGQTLSREEWHAAYEEYGPAMLAYLNQRTGDRQEAEDLLQETFVRVIRSRNVIQDTGKLKSYLFTTAHNVMVNSFRKSRPERLHAMQGEEDPFERIEDTTGSAPDEEAQMTDLREKVMLALEQMSERYRVAFEYGVLEGRSYANIARTTGWSLAQVKVNIHRARKQMIEALQRQGILE